jgi:hypothetical protein
MSKGEARCSKVEVGSVRFSDEHPHRWGRDVMWLRKCRVRRAFRRTLPIRKRNLHGLWCVQKANAPYVFSLWNQRGYAVILLGGQELRAQASSVSASKTNQASSQRSFAHSKFSLRTSHYQFLTYSTFGT